VELLTRTKNTPFLSPFEVFRKTGCAAGPTTMRATVRRSMSCDRRIVSRSSGAICSLDSIRARYRLGAAPPILRLVRA
jgi:hypothetical protein